MVIGADFDWDRYKSVESFLMDIWDRYGSLAAWTLREKTRRQPWRDAFEDGVKHREIGTAQMQAYFSSVL